MKFYRGKGEVEGKRRNKGEYCNPYSFVFRGPKESSVRDLNHLKSVILRVLDITWFLTTGDITSPISSVSYLKSRLPESIPQSPNGQRTLSTSSLPVLNREDSVTLQTQSLLTSLRVPETRQTLLKEVDVVVSSATASQMVYRHLRVHRRTSTKPCSPRRGREEKDPKCVQGEYLSEWVLVCPYLSTISIKDRRNSTFPLTSSITVTTTSDWRVEVGVFVTPQ